MDSAMAVQTPTPDAALTWTALLNFANTGLIIVVGFLLREAWRTIHRRMDEMEERHGDIRERVASLEAASGSYRRRRSDVNRGEE